MWNIAPLLSLSSPAVTFSEDISSSMLSKDVEVDITTVGRSLVFF